LRIHVATNAESTQQKALDGPQPSVSAAQAHAARLTGIRVVRAMLNHRGRSRGHAEIKAATWPSSTAPRPRPIAAPAARWSMMARTM
jgi:hypothetical protein